MTEDRRATPRVTVDTFVRDLFDADDEHSGMILRQLRDVSMDGAFVIDRLQSLDPRCTLEIALPDGGDPIAVRGEVVRRNAEGAAVRFVSVSEDDRARLSRLANS